MRVIGWQLWYDDGRIITSDDVDWAAAPERGVQILMLHYPEGYRDIFHGQETYNLPGRHQVKIGTLLDDVRFWVMVDQALKDQWRPRA